MFINVLNNRVVGVSFRSHRWSIYPVDDGETQEVRNDHTKLASIVAIAKQTSHR